MSASPAGPAPADVAALCQAHLPLVHHEVAGFLTRVPRHVCRDDLVSAGMAALVLAARSFDPSYGVPFARFAARRIKGAILDELRSVDWASRSVRARARQRDIAFDVLCARLGRNPSAEELAAELGVEVAQLDAMDGDVHRAVVLSYDAMEGEGPVDHLMPRTAETPEVVLLQRERVAYLHDAVQELPERLRAVVIGYYFEHRPMKEIAEELGVTESRVSQMRAEALVLVREGMTAQFADPDAAVAPAAGVAARRRQAYYAAVAARSDFRARLSLPRPRTTETSAAESRTA